MVKERENTTSVLGSLAQTMAVQSQALMGFMQQQQQMMQQQQQWMFHQMNGGRGAVTPSHVPAAQPPPSAASQPISVSVSNNSNTHVQSPVVAVARVARGHSGRNDRG